MKKTKNLIHSQNNTHLNRKNTSRILVRQFFKNIEYLRKKEGLKVEEFRLMVAADGMRASKSAIIRYTGRSSTITSGKFDYFNASVYYLAAYALCFNRSVPELMIIDIETEEGLRK